MNNWDLKEDNKDRQKTVKKIRAWISIILTMFGVVILLTQLFPLGTSFIKSKMIEKSDQLQISPVPGAYKREIGGEFAYWDPGRSYFENLISQAVSATDQTVFNPQTREYSEIEIDENYNSPMRISIESLGIINLNITPNVDSFEEKIYNEVLKDGLAHFRTTPLPGGGGNSFIYGHSAVPTYFKNHTNSPEVAFTILEDIKIGDEVKIEKDGKIYTYVVKKKKVVSPDDFSILGQQSWKETVTLMTCTPVGIGTHRLIVTAELKDG